MIHHFPKLKLKKGESILLIATDRQQKRVAKFIKKYKIDYPVFVEPSRKIIRQLQVKSVPAWGVWQREGREFKLKQFSVGKLKQ
jgi:peroxiredoxin